MSHQKLPHKAQNGLICIHGRIQIKTIKIINLPFLIFLVDRTKTPNFLSLNRSQANVDKRKSSA